MHDQLRDGIGYRPTRARPVTEYQSRGHMFDEMNYLIREDTLRHVYQVRVERTPERVQQARPQEAPLPNPGAPSGPRRVKAGDRVGRNDPCPCGSGKKYKNCCGKNAN